jgi:hypothetical protein
VWLPVMLVRFELLRFVGSLGRQVIYSEFK